MKKKVRKKKIRPLGDVLLECEPLWDEMLLEHGLQVSDFIAVGLAYAQLHHPHSIEEFMDGAHPLHLYVHPDYIKKKKGKK